MIDTTKNIADDLDALSSRWASDRSYMGSPVDDVREIVERLRALSARASAGEGGEAVAWRKAYQNGHRGEWRLMPVPSVVLEDANLRNWHGIEYAKFTAAPQPAQAGASGGGEDWREDVHRVMDEGDGYWKACSGCYESVEGYDNTAFPYSDTFRCRLGGGCSECGGLGAIWENLTEADAAEDTPPAHGDGEVWDGEVIRAAFERWAGPQGLRLNRRDFKGSERLGQYCDDDTQLAFEAWREAARPTPEARDAARLDALETYVAEHGGLVLHNGDIRANHSGLGLANTNRSLRRAIDEMARFTGDAALALPAQGEGDNG